ncbi:Protein of uncharacterised function (DUF969) [Leclercia adecarboxylata]|uniref:Protein of uncharacterized function (DUF969) n=1 Tax=Leclercia adecarboxylata TaxID=83655 RepID=A0A4U9HM02_9ENTR|nr:Protein of uncharacterised function (DUF969) [Leclercia adecarboxylata]
MANCRGAVRYRLRAMSAATDNVGLFFGEDIFVAFGAIIFMHNFMLESGGIQTEPLHIALWGIPTALCAFAIHATRLYRLDKHLERELAKVQGRSEMNFQQSYLYWLAGLILLIVALMSFRDKANPRRITTGLFWGIYGLLFLLGTWTYDLVGDKRTVHIAVGVAVVVLALIAGFGGVRLGSYHQRTAEERESSAKRLG